MAKKAALAKILANPAEKGAVTQEEQVVLYICIFARGEAICPGTLLLGARSGFCSGCGGAGAELAVLPRPLPTGRRVSAPHRHIKLAMVPNGLKPLGTAVGYPIFPTGNNQMT